jgi:hypothetical protein
LLLSSSTGAGPVADDDEGVHVDSAEDDIAASSETINALIVRHRGGYSLSTFIPIFFQIYVIQLYAFLVQIVKLGMSEAGK